MKKMPCKSCNERMTEPGKLCRICKAAEASLKDFWNQGPPPGPGSTYEAGFRAGVGWARTIDGEDYE